MPAKLTFRTSDDQEYVVSDKLDVTAYCKKNHVLLISPAGKISCAGKRNL